MQLVSKKAPQQTSLDNNMAATDPLDYNILDIKTKSIEQTLLPLVKQISNLVSHRERTTHPGPGILTSSAARGARAAARVGQAVSLAVDRFVTVGETIADDNHDIRVDMYEACKEARAAGCAIERLCQCDPMGDALAERGGVVRAARALLSAVTRVLLLADVVVVKQLLLAKDRVARSLGRLEGVGNFTEFVKAFSQFGAEMVELAHLTGDRQGDTKDERRRAQMAAARQVLERSTMMLLTSSKACLRHPDCPSARENRDTVFCQMRRAMDLIHYVVKDGVLESAAALAGGGVGVTGVAVDDIDLDGIRTAHGALRQLNDLAEMTRLNLLRPSGSKDRLAKTVDAIVERAHDFTDSAYTSHENRESILLLCERARVQLNQLMRAASTMERLDASSPSEDMEHALTGLLSAGRELRELLLRVVEEQVAELPAATRGSADALATIKSLAMTADSPRVDEAAERFTENMDHVLEVLKLLRHIASTDTLQVSTKYTEINVRIYGPQVLIAAQTLGMHPSSKVAKDNLEVFAEMWQALMSDVAAVSRDVIEMGQNGSLDKHEYMSLPRPGKHGTTSKPLKAVRLDSEEQAKIAKAGLEMKLATSEMEAEADKWRESQENNDIVKRAKNMSSMAFSMYQFTRGEGALKTTQDLFTQAEYFAEEANRLYKVVRHFSYQVPASSHKKELLEQLDRVPTYVQQLQFTVKNSTVGKAATFTKVDNVIQETKNLMNVISKVVTTCFVCATKYNLDFRGLSASGQSGSPYREDEGAGSGAGSDGKSGSGGGSDPSM